MVFGTFDIIHPGHIHMIKEAKAYGDHLVVVVSRDKTVLQTKGRKTHNTETVRLKNFENLKIADNVRLGYLDNKYQVIMEEKPDIIALGYDQKFFIDDLEDAVEDYVKIVRLSPYKADIYKSSKIASHTSVYETNKDTNCNDE